MCVFVGGPVKERFLRLLVRWWIRITHRLPNELFEFLKRFLLEYCVGMLSCA